MPMIDATGPALLVVDDGRESSQSLEALALPLGLRVVNASVEQALGLLPLGGFAGVLVDADACGDARATFARFRDCLPDSAVPVLLLAKADGASNDSLRAYVRDGVDYLAVPIDAAALQLRLSPSAELVRVRERLQQQTRVLHQKEELLEAELLARARAESAMRAKEEVLAIVSHDLRNPMSAILASSGMIAKRAGSDVQKQIEVIERSVARMQKLVSDLLEEVRIEAGQLGLDRREHEIVAFVTQAVEAMKPVAGLKSQELSCRHPSEPCRVMCDVERIFQVLSNLLGNALAFTPVGGHIAISAEQHDGEVRFSVSDDGPGIAPEQLPNIFNRYWQANHTRAGVGLGLSIAKGIIHAHGGRIWVESEVGRGTTFHFTLPLAKSVQ